MASATTDPTVARQLVAAVRPGDDLAAALPLHACLPCSLAWLVSHTRRGDGLGDTAIRQARRTLACADPETTAVPAPLSASRWRRA